MCALMTIASTMIGSRISGKNSHSGASAGVSTMPGTQPSQTLNTKISRVADTNSGMVIAKIAIDDTAKSNARSRHSAHKTPSNSAGGMPANIAQPVSNNVFNNRSPTSEAMVSRPLMVTPKSPRNAPPTQSK